MVCYVRASIYWVYEMHCMESQSSLRKPIIVYNMPSTPHCQVGSVNVAKVVVLLQKIIVNDVKKIRQGSKSLSPSSIQRAFLLSSSAFCATDQNGEQLSRKTNQRRDFQGPSPSFLFV